jgi:hypothetical protein
MSRTITRQDYEYKTEPYEHQREGFLLSRDEPDFALLMEMGTGKSKIIIDTAAYLWQKGLINFLLVVAPNDVHKNWAYKEIPAHLPDWCERRVCVWTGTMKAAQWKSFWSLWDADYKGLRILVVNIEAFQVAQKFWRPYLSKMDKKKPKWGPVIRKIVNAFDVMGVVDESTRIKTPGIKTSKRLHGMRKHLKYARIMTGTPITKSPLDAFSQFLFLGWQYLGFTNYWPFSQRYAQWERRIIEHKDGRTSDFKQLTGFCHLDELQENIAKVSFRVLKKDCLDLPEKIYTRRHVEMEPEQKRIYKQIQEKNLIEIQNEPVTVKNILVKLLRLQQVLGGFVPKDKEGNVKPIFDNPEHNPRVKSLLNLIEENGEAKMIIWSRFVPEIEMIVDLLNKLHGDGKAVAFYGKNKDTRNEGMYRFQGARPIIENDLVIGHDPIPEDEQATWFVGNQKAGGYGLDLTCAAYSAYYSNDYSLEHRLQSEDRPHRIGQFNPCTYIDFECEGTQDTRIIQAYMDKKELADLITGDDPLNWLRPVAI